MLINFIQVTNAASLNVMKIATPCSSAIYFEATFTIFEANCVVQVIYICVVVHGNCFHMVVYFSIAAKEKDITSGKHFPTATQMYIANTTQFAPKIVKVASK